MIYRLDSNPASPFPDVSLAETVPNGLLAVGGDLSPQRLINAYRNGIFPWYNANEPILWWSPDPRTLLFPEHLHISRSLRKSIRRLNVSLSIDTCFEEVIIACAAPRSEATGTWLQPEMIEAYCQLHRLGLAHSAEVRLDGQLVGGIYGVSIGQVFYGESMFSRITDASKIAMVYLCECLIRWNYRVMDCQVHSDHLATMGAESVDRTSFCTMLENWCTLKPTEDAWL